MYPKLYQTTIRTKDTEPVFICTEPSELKDVSEDFKKTSRDICVVVQQGDKANMRHMPPSVAMTRCVTRPRCMANVPE